MRYGVWLIGLLVLTATWPAAPAAQKPKPEALVDQVRKAIDGGITWLRRNQNDNGTWNDKLGAYNHPGGTTCLALLALLNAGVEPNDPMIRKGLTYLRSEVRSPTTYVRSLQTMVYAEAGFAEDKGRIQENVSRLVKIRILRNGLLDGWSYDQPGNPNRQADNSNTQFALLALHVGRLAGAHIDRKVWEEIRQFYIRTQNDDGGWSYAPRDRVAFGNSGSSLTMTSAGVCGLIIAGMELNQGREVLRDNGTADNCGKYQENKPLQRGLSWISSPDRDRFSLEVGNPPRTFYNLYGLERAGRLSGLRFFHSHDWYREGCQWLVQRQRPSEGGGYWTEAGGWDSWPVVSTSFALLFLSKGRTPILISKLAHGDSPRHDNDLDWNNDRNDCKHLVEYSSKELFKRLPLGWQTFDMLRAVSGRPLNDALELEIASDLLQSPIAYFNGHKSPERRFTAGEKRLLQRYVENGGCILAEACCGSREFDRGFHALCRELWPQNPLELLPAEHPIWKAHFPVPPGSFKLKGIQLGCKTVVIYSPEDLSCLWEQNKTDTPRGALAFRLGANIVAYATGMEPPRPRLHQEKLVNDKDDFREVQRGFLKVGQLQHEGDWRPAPRAMTKLMAHLRERAGLDVVLATETIQPHLKSVVDFKFLYMHGRKEFSFQDNELKHLRFNLENGGLLLADACCGKDAFDRSFRKFVAQLFPKHKLEPIKPEEERRTSEGLFSKELNGEELSDKNIRCRVKRNELLQAMDPALEGIRINGRWVVIYSRYDLGCALERHSSSDCLSYDHESALRIAGAAVLYTLRP
ncbi:MAG: DUF4159 domain-containing protein, partial [Gemmataceae bacterium]|nr:DUF4159 domain-containing protein [Gemmataceae bacterium]